MNKKFRSWFGDPWIRRIAVNVVWLNLCLIFVAKTVSHLVNLPPGQSTYRYFILLLLAIIMEAVAYRRYSQYLIRYAEQRIAAMRSRIIDSVRNTGLTAFEHIGQEAIYTTLTYDVGEISSLSRTIGHAIMIGTRFFMIYLYTVSLSWLIFVIFSGFIAVAGMLYVYIQIRMRTLTDRIREKEKQMFDDVSYLLDGFKELRLHAGRSESFFHACLSSHAAEVRYLKSESHLCFIFTYILWYGLWFGLLITFFLIIPRIDPSLENIVMASLGVIMVIPRGTFITHLPKIIMSNISLHRMARFENFLKELTPESAEESEEVKFAEIRYDDIAFRYDREGDHPFSMGPINMRVQAGEIVFTTGGNGSGKSTLLKLMTGLYPVQSGRICLNGKEIRMEEYRWLFSAIFTDYHLFDRLYGIGSVDEARVDTLLRMFQLDKKVRFEEEVFNTHDLSTGQKKRLALLMAIMEDKPIYIFDEWAADQDPQFRKYFYETLLPSFKAQGKTVIAVTHDDLYFHVADRVVKLEYGQIAAEPHSPDIRPRWPISGI